VLFEAVVHAVHRAASAAVIAFNTVPEVSGDAVARWLPTLLSRSDVPVCGHSMRHLRLQIRKSMQRSYASHQLRQHDNVIKLGRE
jgi:hypothetical protein